MARPSPSLINGRPRRLTLVRAPAGWGKSSLLSAWAGDAGETRPFGWLSLDDGDNDPIRFFSYTIEALRTPTPTIGHQSLAILKAPGVNLVDDVLPVLLNELEGLPELSILAMEDYHLIRTPRSTRRSRSCLSTRRSHWSWSSRAGSSHHCRSRDSAVGEILEITAAHLVPGAEAVRWRLSTLR